MLFVFGGRQEIVDASKAYARCVLENPSLLESTTAEQFRSYFPLSELTPIDMFIRTGNHPCLSDAPLWHLAYSELFFSDTLWPDFSVEELMNSIEEFNQRERRYGL